MLACKFIVNMPCKTECRRSILIHSRASRLLKPGAATKVLISSRAKKCFALYHKCYTYVLGQRWNTGIRKIVCSLTGFLVFVFFFVFFSLYLFLARWICLWAFFLFAPCSLHWEDICVESAHAVLSRKISKFHSCHIANCSSVVECNVWIKRGLKTKCIYTLMSELC